MKFFISLVFFYTFFLKSFLLYSQKTGTLKDHKGKIMRGSPMILGGNKSLAKSNLFTLDLKNWVILKRNHINTVRVCWVDPYYQDRQWGHSTEKEMIASFDLAVSHASSTGMNIIINYHNVGEQTKTYGDSLLDMSRLERFWKVLAPRYKNNPLVFYEITNEPIFGQSFAYYKEPFKTRLLGVYKLVRGLAPKRQLIMFSFNEAKAGIIDAVNAYKLDLDWDYTAVGFHMYNENSSKHILQLMHNYRVICTEWDYDFQSKKPKHEYIKRVDGYKENAQALEKIGCSWIDWRSWGDTSLNEALDTLQKDAIKNSYHWWSQKQ
jgi:hypothetical protein